MANLEEVTHDTVIDFGWKFKGRRLQDAVTSRNAKYWNWLLREHAVFYEHLRPYIDKYMHINPYTELSVPRPSRADLERREREAERLKLEKETSERRRLERNRKARERRAAKKKASLNLL